MTFNHKMILRGLLFLDVSNGNISRLVVVVDPVFLSDQPHNFVLSPRFLTLVTMTAPGSSLTVRTTVMD